MGTSIVAVVVGVLALLWWFGVVLWNFGGTQENYTPRLFKSGVVIAVTAVIFFGFAIENDHWTWEGDKLVSKDDWESCGSYVSGICETMDQWNEKKC